MILFKVRALPTLPVHYLYSDFHKSFLGNILPTHFHAVKQNAKTLARYGALERIRTSDPKIRNLRVIPFMHFNQN